MPQAPPRLPQISPERLKQLKWGELIDPTDLSKGKYFPLHPYQEQIFHSKARFTAAIAGTGGGKTVVGALWALKQLELSIIKYGKVLGFIVAPTYKILSRATAPTFVETLLHTQYGPTAGGRYLESKSYYELPRNWGKIWLQGADNPYGLEGGQFDFVWIDEGGQLQKKAFNALEGRTGQKESPLLVTTTPYITNEGFGPLHKEWVPRYKQGDKNYFVLHFPSIANPRYPKEEFERARRSLTPELFKSRYEGLFEAVEGLVYPSFSKCKRNIPSEAISWLINQQGRLYGGIDFGWNDPFCALSGFLSNTELVLEGEEYPPDTLFVWYERYKSMTIIEDHASSMPKFLDKTILWYAENNPEQIKKLKKGGHFTKKAPKFARGVEKSALVNGIIMVNSRINTGRLIIFENRCPALCAEAEIYVYPEKNEEIIGDKPLDRDNHALDALRYMIMGIDQKRAA